MSRTTPHLEDTRIQDFLDRALSPEEERRVRTHLDACARCRDELESWRGVFARLEEVPGLAPSPLLSARVMDAVRNPAEVGLLARLRGLLPSRERPDAHLDPRLLLEYLDQALVERRRSRAAAHLEVCPRCRAELSGWRALVTELEGLERMEPSPGFADAVMSRVRLPDPDAERIPLVTAGRRVAARAAVRAGEWATRLRPRTRRAWVLASVPVVAPVAVLVVGAVALFSSHPLLTPTSLASFLFWQVTGAAEAVAASAFGGVMANPLLLEVWRVARESLTEPALVGAGAVVFSVTTMAALWILYRNLAPVGVVDRGYANGAR